MKKIKITSAQPGVWYSKHVGEVFEIHRMGEHVVWVREKDNYSALNYVSFLDFEYMEGDTMQEQKMTITNAIRFLQKEIHYDNVKAGWWTDLETGSDLVEQARKRTRLGLAITMEKIALCHSELSEGTEGVRKNLMDDKLPHRKMVEVEFADAIIRILDLADVLELDVGGAIEEKRAFNKIRPDHKIENRQKENGKAC